MMLWIRYCTGTRFLKLVQVGHSVIIRRTKLIFPDRSGYPVTIALIPWRCLAFRPFLILKI